VRHAIAIALLASLPASWGVLWPAAETSCCPIACAGESDAASCPMAQEETCGDENALQMKSCHSSPEQVTRAAARAIVPGDRFSFELDGGLPAAAAGSTRLVSFTLEVPHPPPRA
jgi:hypothetical protein